MTLNENWRSQMPGLDATAEGPTGFAAFAMKVRNGDTVGAGASLMDLMGLSPVSAQQAASHFVARFEQDPSSFQQALEIRAAITEGNMNDALQALSICFGLEGIDGLTAIGKLKELVDES